MNSNNNSNLTGYIGNDGKFSPATEGDNARQAALFFQIGVRRMPSKGRESATDWIDCVVYNKRAEALKDLLKKGTKVTVLGSLRSRKIDVTVDGKDTTRTITSLVVEDLEFQSSPKSETSSNDAEAPAEAPAEEIVY